MPTPSSSSSTVHRPLGPAALFVLFLVIAALVIIGLMRAVTPVKERIIGTVPTSTTTPIVPGTPIPDDTDGKPGGTDTEVAPSSTVPITTVPITTVRPRPAGALCDAQNFICVNVPQARAALTNPFMITGTAIAFEQTVQYELQDAQGVVIASGFTTANAPDVGQAGPFETRVFFNQLPTSVTGTLVVFESSARDGKRIHEVQIPVQFTRGAPMKRILFFAPLTVQPPEAHECGTVQPISVSLPSSSLPIEATLRALLQVNKRNIPDEWITTFIPDGTRLVSLTLTNGVAKAVFSSELEAYGGGSCNVAAIRAQIESTLKQFSSVRSVVISVDGKTPEESLQP